MERPQPDRFGSDDGAQPMRRSQPCGELGEERMRLGADHHALVRADRARHEWGEALVRPLREPGVSWREHQHEVDAVVRGDEPPPPEESADEHLELRGIWWHAPSDAARVGHGIRHNG